MFLGMRQRQRRALHAQARGKLARLAAESNRRSSAGLAPHLDVSPCHAVFPSGADGLERGFLGGKACRVAFDAIGFGVAVPDFILGKDAAQKALAEPLNRGGDARHFDNVNAGPDYHAGKPITLAHRLRKAVAYACDGNSQLATHNSERTTRTSHLP